MTAAVHPPLPRVGQFGQEKTVEASSVKRANAHLFGLIHAYTSSRTFDTITLVRSIFWNTIVGLSALLMVLTVAEWVRTDQDFGWVSYGTPSAYWEACSSTGHLRVARAKGFSHSIGWQVHSWRRDSTMPRFADRSTSTMHGAFGFTVASGGFAYGRFSAVRYSILDVAYWGLLLVFSLAPTAHFIATTLRLRRLTRRLSQIQCAVCGYDLRATQDRCPECGTVPSHLSKARIAGSGSA